ncbi:MAG: Ppx/GppA phosphatase family protein [Roseitalea porphyridii]|jgi:exopolyphosphatase/guanosine-5'-triphosphate,3'-diphosphate pyrophosphatase|uniref:Ppx/GppA phosphatase family protein n=1 Tax=Roseitalea porphyridii TaxID=1852022 RepID=UPI0032EC730F
MPGPDTLVSPAGPSARDEGEPRSGRGEKGLTDGDRQRPSPTGEAARPTRDRIARGEDVREPDGSRTGGAHADGASGGAGSDAGPFAKRPSKRGRRRRRRSTSAEAPPTDKPAPQRKGRRRKPRGTVVGPARNEASVAAEMETGPAESAPAPSAPPQAPALANRTRPSQAYAALDLGTNNCRLLVAVPARPGAFRVVDAFSRIVRLGEGLGASGRLSDAAMDRAVEALAVCRDKLIARPVERTRLIATEACRSADNGAAFLERVYRETGLKLEVVDRETEARLAVAGCGSLVDRTARSTVLFDIGGGSSEIAVIDLDRGGGRNLSDNIVGWTSLPIGVVTLAERFGGTHVDPQSFAAMVAHAEELLADFAARHRRSGGGRDDAFHLIGTSGTVTTLAGIHLGLKRYDRRRVDGLWMADHEVDRINDRLLSWSFDERVANPCIGRDRADLVLAGCAILQAIRNVWPARRLRVADRGLREGLLTEMMAADGVWRRSRYRRGRARGQSAPKSGGR